MASGRHRRPDSRARKVTKRALVSASLALIVLSTGLVLAYKKFEGNINTISTASLGDRPKAEKVEGPKAPLNVLVMGSDTRDGANGKGIGGSTPGLSDTTILLHLSADRKRAYGVSLPRDSMVQRPTCPSKSKSGPIPGGLTMFNSAYAVGGPLCTVKTVESLTGIRIDHFVVVDFVGFRSMVNALGGIKICVPEAVDDQIGHIKLPAGTYKVTGQQALDYVRVRHGIGAPTGDIGRMKRQQAFIAAMIQKVMSAGTLANPPRLFSFLDAATKSLTTDESFADLKQLASLGSSLQDIGLDKVQFVTVPFRAWPEDPNRLEWSPEAEGLWKRIRKDQPLGPYGSDSITAAQDNRGEVVAGEEPSQSPSGSPSTSPSGGASGGPAKAQGPSKAEIKQAREAAGLCTT
ncbi:MAG: LCP family protein [Nocardioidaceae bacterium]